jgi:hypothetical protein
VWKQTNVRPDDPSLSCYEVEEDHTWLCAEDTELKAAASDGVDADDGY